MGHTVEHLAALLIEAERHGLPLHIESGIISMPDPEGCCEVCRSSVDLSDFYELLDVEGAWAERTRERDTGDEVRARRTADLIAEYAKTCWRPVG